MATNDVERLRGTVWSLADHAGDFVPSAALHTLEQGSVTDVQLSLASVANDAARQGVKINFGSPWDFVVKVGAAFELAASGLTAGDYIAMYMGFSDSATVGTANPANTTGADAAYDGYSTNLDEALKQLRRIATFIVTGQATTTVQVDTDCGRFTPGAQYGNLVVVNRSGAAFHSDDVEDNIILTALKDQIQAAV